EPVHLADHRIAGDAAKLRSDLARRQPIRPEFLQRFDALIGPGHASNSSPVAAAEEVQTESHSGPGQRPVGPTHTRATDLRYDLSAARSVVFDDGKATIWRGAGAKGPAARFPKFFPRLPNASTPIFKLVQCGNVCDGRPGVLRPVDSQSFFKTKTCPAAPRSGTIPFP